MNDNHKDENEFIDFPYIGGCKKPYQKNKKRILTDDELERMTY